MTRAERLDPRPGAAIYSRRVLALYDLLVLGFSNTYLWKCPSTELVDWYNRNISSKHLDVGVGTGYFLDRCRFPSPDPTVALLDLNEESLRFTAERIARYRPVSYRASVLDPVQIDLAPFQSIGLNYLLHCLPGDMQTKAQVFANLKPLLAPGGVVFGSTILGQGVPRGRIARAVMSRYNARGIFGNQNDSVEGLRAALSGLRSVEINIRGCVALFSARA